MTLVTTATHQNTAVYNIKRIQFAVCGSASNISPIGMTKPA